MDTGSNEFVNPEALHKSLGGFWYSVYEGRDQVFALLTSVAEVHKQIVQESKELYQSLNRRSVPVFREIQWVPVSVRESVLRESSKRFKNYGDDGSRYGDSVQYGALLAPEYRIAIPNEIISVSAVQNSILHPVVSVVDPVVDGHTITLSVNPFDSNDWNVRELYDDLGNVVDREVVVWLRSCRVDKEDLYNLFGYVLGVKLPSSERYRDLINALMDCLVNGPTKQAVLEIAGALVGIPVVRNEIETVCEISDHQVRTDKSVYSFSENDTIMVSVGDVLHKGDSMSSGMVLVDGAPSVESVPVISFNRGFVSIDAGTNVLVPNREVSMSTSIKDGRTRVEFPVEEVCEAGSTLNDQIWARGIESIHEITDACELTQIKQALKLPNVALPVDQVDEETSGSGGLGAWLLFHRFT